ncbi:MAG: hypothetical protein KIS78_26250 [Labilithrix sp.]|nr:hypothetical protein [Labilithrix sp.]
MTNEERELAGWQAEWSEIADVPAFERAIGARVARDRRRLLVAAAGEVGGAILGIAVIAWLLARTHGSAFILSVTIPLLVFLGAWLTRFFEMRRGLFRAPGESVAAFIELTRKRLAAEIEWMRFARRSTTILGIAVVFWAAWAFVKYFDEYTAEPWRAVVGFGGAGIILAGLAWWIPRKQARLMGELARFEEVVGRASLDVS